MVQSTGVLNKALKLPKFYLKYKYGTNNRDNRTYPQVVKKYQDKLAANPGVIAKISRNMPTITQANKERYISQLDKEKAKLIKKFKKSSEMSKLSE